MKKEECFFLGTISRKHGYKGELNIKLDISSSSFLEDVDYLFIDIDNQLVPYFLTSLRFKKSMLALVKFEDISSEEEAKSMIGKEIYLPLTFSPEQEDLDSQYVNFLAIDYTHGPLGKIIDVQKNSAQSLFVINYQQKEILIPIVDNYIQSVDVQKKEIVLRTPDGLLTLFE